MEYTIKREVPSNILNLHLTELLCKHIFDTDKSIKAKKLLEESEKLSYKWCQWNVYAGQPKNFDYDMGRILKMEEDNYNHAIRVVVCKYLFSEKQYIWSDNLHTTIMYLRKYGLEAQLKDVPFYVVDLTEFSQPVLYSQKGYLRENPKDITGAIASAKVRSNFSNSKELIAVGYTVGDFIQDNIAFYTYKNKNKNPKTKEEEVKRYNSLNGKTEDEGEESFNFKGSLTKGDLKGKIVFWDIDGTLAPYRFNGHIADPNGSLNGQSEDEVANGIFLRRKPSKFMQKVLQDCKAKRNLVLGHYAYTKEVEDKYKWIEKYYPEISSSLFVNEEKSKAEAILEYCKENKIELEDVVYIDDVISFLREAEHKGISSWHISSLLDYFI